jgi:hypothetical protein
MDLHLSPARQRQMERAVPLDRQQMRHPGRTDPAWQRLRCISTAMTTTAMYPNNDTLGERLRLYVEESFHDA